MVEELGKVAVNKVITPGLPLTIEVESKDGNKILLKSNIHDIFPESGLLKIAMPSYKGQLVPLPKGEMIYVTVFKGQVLYSFSSRVIDYGRDEDNFLVMRITIPKTVKRIQRRRYLRIPLFKTGYYVLPGSDEKHQFTTKDFSAGGMLMCTKELLVTGQPLLITLNLGAVQLTNQKAEVVRYAGKNNSTGLHEYGVRFLEVPPELEKQLVFFVFQCELRLRKGISGEED